MTIKKHLKSKYLRLVFKLMNLKVLGIAVSYLFTALITNYYGAEVWGAFSLALLVISVASVIALAGLDTALLRKTAYYFSNNQVGEIRHLFSSTVLFVLVSSCFSALIVGLSADLIAQGVFNDEALVDDIKTAAFGIPAISLLTLVAQNLRAINSNGWFLFHNHIGRYLLPMCLILFGVFILKTQPNPVTAFVVGLYILAFVSLLQFIGKSGLIKHSRTVGISFNQLLLIGLPLLLANSVNFIKGWLDTFMIGVYLDTLDVGIYSVALKISKLLTIPITVVNTMVASKFASLKDKNKLGREVQRSTRLITLLTLPLAVFIFLFPGFVLSFFGIDPELGREPLSILLFALLINAMAGSVGLFMQMQGYQKAYGIISVVALVFSILANILLIPRIGILGAAWSTLFTQLFWNLACVIYVKHAAGIFTFYWPFNRQ